MSEPVGRGVAWTDAPKGRGAAWTEERRARNERRSDEGRQRAKAPRRRKQTENERGATREGSALERPGGANKQSAAAIVGALSAAGTRLLFGIPGGGPNLDVVGAAAASGLRFVLAHGETAATIMAATCADLTGAPAGPWSRPCWPRPTSLSGSALTRWS